MEKGCPSCGRMIDYNLKKCNFCGYDFGDYNKAVSKYVKLKEERKRPKYAGFIKRVCADSIDGFLMSLFMGIAFSVYLVLSMGDISSFYLSDVLGGVIFIEVIGMVVYLLYCSIMQGSKYASTIGQRVVGIQVVNEKELGLTFRQAFIRNLARILDVITFGIGSIMIIFTKKKQSLSDMVTHSYVTNVIDYMEDDRNSYASGLSRFVAYVIDVAYLCLLIYLYFYLGNLISDMDYSGVVMLVIGIVLVIYEVIYFPYMESRSGATIGKKMLKIRVADMNGNNVSFWRSCFRIILMWFEGMISFGTILCFVSFKKQTLKDILSKTVVINN